MDELVEEKRMLWDALDNLVSLWDMEADMRTLEDSVARARHALNATNVPEELK
jgi:hypothetical protein